MDKNLENRLETIETELQRFSEVIDGLGRDVDRPVSAVRDGYYEAALTNAGSIIESMLQDVWRREGIKGEEKKKTIEQLFSVVKQQAEMDRLVQDYVRDVQLVRNRAAHGEEIVPEDCLEALRKLSVILDWYFGKYIGSPEQEEEASGTVPEAEPGRSSWKRIVLFAALLIVVIGGGTLKILQHRQTDRMNAMQEFRVVIAPFHGATTGAAEEGQVMRGLLFSSIAEVLEDESRVQVLTPEDDEAPRTEAEALDYGKPHFADLTIWGTIFTLGGETVIEPRLTSSASEHGMHKDRASVAAAAALVKSVEKLETGATEAGQLALRQTKAGEVRDLAVYVVASHCLAKNPDRALELLRNVPTPEARVLEGQIFEKQFRLDQAEQRYADVIESDPEHLGAALGLADIAYKRREYATAEHWYRLAVAKDITLPWDSYFNLGMACDRQGKIEDAIEALLVCVRHYPSVTWDLATYLGNLGRPEDAVEPFLRVYPDYAAIETMIDAHCKNGDFKAALQAIDAAKANHRKDFGGKGLSHYFQAVSGYLLVAAGLAFSPGESRYSEGEPWFNEQEEQHWRARVYLLKGDLDTAIEIYRETKSDLLWRNEHPRFHLALAYYLRGDLDDAAAAAELNWREDDNHNGGLLLYLTRMRQNDTNEAARIAEEMTELGQWNGVLEGTYDNALLPDERPKWRCILAWYLGAHARVNGNPEQAREILEIAVDTGMRHLPEWHLARFELEQLSAAE